MPTPKWSEFPTAETPVNGTDVVVGLQQRSTESDETNVQFTVDDLAAYVLSQDSGLAGGNAFGKIVVSGQSDVDADTSSDTLTLVAGSNVTLTTNAGSDSVTIAAAGGNSFGTVAVSGQSDVVADAANDTLTLAAGSNITITTNAGTDTVTIAASGGNAFGKIVVSGQSDVDADTAADTLTLVAGSGVTLTTNAGSDSVTIAASGGGAVVQVKNTQTGAVATGTGIIPADDTIPQNTEGTEFMTLAITPTSATNKLRIDVVGHAASSTSAPFYLAAALFQDSTANALAVQAKSIATTGHGADLVFTHYMTAGTTSPTTFKVRMGGNAAGTTTFNGITSGRLYGGVFASSITITEIVP